MDIADLPPALTWRQFCVQYAPQWVAYGTSHIEVVAAGPSPPSDSPLGPTITRQRIALVPVRFADGALKRIGYGGGRWWYTNY